MVTILISGRRSLYGKLRETLIHFARNTIIFSYPDTVILNSNVYYMINRSKPLNYEEIHY